MKGDLFLVGVLVLYAIVGIFDWGTALASIRLFMQIFLQILPVFFLVFFFIFMVDLVIQPEKVVKHLGRQSGCRGWCIALIGGILSAGPIYVWYPLLADLRERGMRTALISAFMNSRAVKLPLLPLMVYYFGVAFTIVITVYMVVFSLIVGILTERLVQERP
jgi:uncharacterized membrane protein YraQ (UPF0718 family)